MPGKSEITIPAFAGMNNLDISREIAGKNRAVRPRIILNANVTADGEIIKRDGVTKTVSLTNGHSEWACNLCHLVVDGTTLKRIEGDTAITIGSVGSFETPTYYAEVDGIVYIANKAFTGVFDPTTNILSQWGISLPPGPMVSEATSGGLAKGTYQVCLTASRGSVISGNGPISRIEITSDGKAIAIANRSPTDIVWCTDPNGNILYNVGPVNTIVNVPSVEPLPSLWCQPPPFMEFITYAFGRMWGASGRRLYCSEPFRLDWWKIGTAYFEFSDQITLIARVKTGLFVGCKTRTFFLMGTTPEEMQQSDVGCGAIPGTLAYCNDLVELGDTISPTEKRHVSVPVWVSQEGIVIGNPVGRLFALSQPNVRFTPGERGAALYRRYNGQFQYLTSFKKGPEQEGLGMSDDATVEVIRNGAVI
ncbi:MAG: hypothetical protein JRI80_04910 [Deltaproteobacteria bacterium]|nr:hypothetical protein [Deltaproteobacteria bacterium]